MESELHKKIKTSIFWSFLSTILPQIIQLVVTIVLARLLFPEDFGLMGMAMVVIAFLDLFKDAGLGQALIQYRDGSEEVANSAFWIQLVVGIFCMAVIWLIAPLVSLYFKRVELIDILHALSLTFLASPFISIPVSILTRRLHFKGIFYRQSIALFLSGSVSIAMVYSGFGVWSLVAAYIINNYLLALMFLNEWHPTMGININHARRLLTFGYNLTVQGILMWLNSSLFQLFIGRYQGAMALGHLNMAINLGMKPMSLLAGPLARVMLPTFSEIVRQNDDLKSTYINALKGLSTIGIPLCTAMFFLTPSFVINFLGQKWMLTIPAIRILLVCAVIGNLVVLNNEIYKSMGIPQILTKLMIVSSFFSIPLFFFAARHGLITMLYAFLLWSVAFNSINIYICKNVLNFTWKEFFSTIKGSIQISTGITVLGLIQMSIIPSNGIGGFLLQISLYCVIFLTGLRFFEYGIFKKFFAYGKGFIWKETL
jgi:PST family polysaccharide transporter